MVETGRNVGVELLEADPDLGADLTPPELAQATREIVVRRFEVEMGAEAALQSRSKHPGLIGFFVLEGLLLRELHVAGTVAAELLGEGDLVHPGDVRGSDLSPLRGRVHWKVLAPTQLALLDGRFSARAAPWPQVMARITLRAVWRTHGLALNLAISNQRHMDDRLLLLFWHLAQRWGRVRRDAVVLDLPLTHETLAKLVGAHRPSVTSALGSLARRGLLLRDEAGWKLPLPIPEGLDSLLSSAEVRRRVARGEGSEAPGLAAADS